MDRTLAGLIRHVIVGVLLLCAAPAAALATTDPLLAEQWALADPAAVGAQEAWTQSHGAGVLVAVLDTGVEVRSPRPRGEHLDQSRRDRGQWTRRRSERDRRRRPRREHVRLTADVSDDNGHGTHNAGIIAALQDNGIGGSGLAPEATILPVKVLDAQMSGDTDVLARGIRYAVDEGARIINVSLNTDVSTDSVASAVRYAGEHGALIVASAGNGSRNIDLRPSFPASLPDPAVLAVAAGDAQGALWNGSNTGRLSVDLVAPGASIASTARGSGYQWRTGTSAAAPFVAASLALLSSAVPTCR